MKSYKRHGLLAALLISTYLLINYLNSERQIIVPDINFTDIDGQSHQLKSYLGKPILVVFWATDCPGCIKEMPELITLYHEFASQGLTMLGVAMSHDSLKHIKAMRDKKKLPYILTWDNTTQITRAFDNVRVTPTHFLIGPDGKIVMRKIGSLNIDHLHKRLYEMGLKPA